MSYPQSETLTAALHDVPKVQNLCPKSLSRGLLVSSHQIFLHEFLASHVHFHVHSTLVLLS